MADERSLAAKRLNDQPNRPGDEQPQGDGRGDAPQPHGSHREFVDRLRLSLNVRRSASRDCGTPPSESTGSNTALVADLPFWSLSFSSLWA